MTGKGQQQEQAGCGGGSETHGGREGNDGRDCGVTMEMREKHAPGATWRGTEQQLSDMHLNHHVVQPAAFGPPRCEDSEDDLSLVWK